MTITDLNAALARLRAELQHADIRDPKGREHIEALIQDVERNAAAAGGGTRAALLARIEATTRRFEVDHPVLTGALGRIATALSAMGI